MGNLSKSIKDKISDKYRSNSKTITSQSSYVKFSDLNFKTATSKEIDKNRIKAYSYSF